MHRFRIASDIRNFGYLPVDKAAIGRRYFFTLHLFVEFSPHPPISLLPCSCRYWECCVSFSKPVPFLAQNSFVFKIISSISPLLVLPFIWCCGLGLSSLCSVWEELKGSSLVIGHFKHLLTWWFTPLLLQFCFVLYFVHFVANYVLEGSHRPGPRISGPARLKTVISRPGPWRPRSPVHHKQNWQRAKKSHFKEYQFDINPDLTENQRDALINLHFEYKDIFACNMKELSCYKNYEVELDTVSHKPFFIKQYRLPDAQKEIAQKEIDDTWLNVVFWNQIQKVDITALLLPMDRTEWLLIYDEVLIWFVGHGLLTQKVSQRSLRTLHHRIVFINQVSIVIKVSGN